jgi:5-deoxy-glucuronate isomerase
MTISPLLVKAARIGRVVADITPASAGWRHVGFRALRLGAGEEEAFDLPANRELCITLLTGQADVQVDGALYTALGGRASVFDDAAPAAVYVPPGRRVRIAARGAAEVALSTAPAEGRLPPRVIEPGQMKRSVRGQGSNTRYVCDILPEGEPAEGLLVVEVVTPAGHSSSYPPHKHDTAREGETSLEETYYHMLRPEQGFAFQRVYTDDRSLTPCWCRAATTPAWRRTPTTCTTSTPWPARSAAGRSGTTRSTPGCSKRADLVAT